ncbi:hypothetical protein EIP91_006185 [Steccherinum ochraceum]|uniref:Calcineurin-like phosphoesterase domain-containing protein n=1 Tax=Steccherinum ochraceum TaxID=92696 RepID=A0A4R0RKV4_9APHY|nr:hypothetical protein EIP91_006185 [Steccherinum ochraceum]
MDSDIVMEDATGTMKSSTKPSTAVVYRDYNIGDPPPRPGPEWTRFVCISDTHSRTFAVPPGDVLLHGGDLTNTGTYAQLELTVHWLENLPHPKKIIIAGNHDIALHQRGDWYSANFQRWHQLGKENIDNIRELLTGSTAQQAGLVYLEDQKCEFQAKNAGRQWSVYGSPWSPWFHEWAFNYHRGDEAETRAAEIEKTDILLTHGPPFQILDRTLSGEQVGCEALMARLPSLRPRLHVFGHIHEDHGVVIHDWSSQDAAPSYDTGVATETASRDCTVFVNAANWPAGKKAWQPGGKRTPFGGGSFLPVIVDLLDDDPVMRSRGTS